ncbi:MAG: TraR/DksA C4-type zinc finger protein [Chloroflexi bacterium]|nr:TraR/DksA C4-type zinc finger protein [Chloroflexota bacterium]
MANLYENLRQRLAQDRERLRQELAQMKASHVAMVESGSREGSAGEHLADSATDTSELETSLALQANLHKLLEDVDRALRKLDDGSYGTCESCGQPINPERLEAIPSAKLCISCKAQQERDERGTYLRR